MSKTLGKLAAKIHRFMYFFHMFHSVLETNISRQLLPCVNTSSNEYIYNIIYCFCVSCMDHVASYVKQQYYH